MNLPRWLSKGWAIAACSFERYSLLPHAVMLERRLSSKIKAEGVFRALRAREQRERAEDALARCGIRAHIRFLDKKMGAAFADASDIAGPQLRRVITDGEIDRICAELKEERRARRKARVAPR